MDILTLGKMNQMAKDTNQALELMANHVYEGLNDICEVQAVQLPILQTAVADGITVIEEAAAGAGGTDMYELPFIMHTSHDSVSNGGCHLQWTVPDETKVIKIELQGGGGGGGPSQCCMIGRGGGTGAYASKMLYADTHFTPGSSVYDFCSGGTTPCSCCTCCTGLNACGWCGCPSYANGPGLSGYCANGGTSGWNRCSTWCYSCLHPAQNGNCTSQPACACGNFDHQIQGISGTLQESQYCWNDKHSIAGPGSGPFAVSSGTGMDGCRANVGCCVHHSLFSSGGGGTPYAHSSCCWGGWGAGGLVKVTYWK